MNDFIKENKELVKLITMTFFLLLLTLTIFTGVGVVNEMKKGRYIGDDIASRNTISVSGEGEVFVKPDLATINFTVTNEESTVEKATEKNNKTMNKIISELQDRGIEERDIKTTNYSINPRYEWREVATLEIYPRPEGKRALIGYEVRQTLNVKIRDMESVGDIIEVATDAGANQVGGISFVVENEDEYKKEAREVAIKEAQEKAKTLASQLGVKLVGIVNFYEDQSIPRYFSEKMMASDAVGMGGGTAPDIQTGENEIKVNVNITYQID